jgi:phosphoribosylanthranilate isomerase
MWVKICGNTNLEDAALAVELGADAVGFVFAASLRQVTLEQVAAITRNLPAGAERVGVFDSHDPESIAEAATAAGLTTVQLHGGFDEELLQRLGRRLAGGIRIIQTLHWPVGQESPGARIGGQMERILGLGITGRVLIDSKVGAAGGGTGVAFDWTAARGVFSSAPNGVQLILAGGLRPDTVSQAIGQLGPWGVDVSSGVEAAPGRKDPQRLRRFIENARAAANPDLREDI